MAHLIINLLFSILFFMAFSSKVVNITNFSIEIYSYRIISFKQAQYAAPLVLAIELILSLLFLTQWLVEITTISTIFLLSFFTIFLLKKRLISEKKSCSCFGDNKLLNRYPLTRNLILIVLLIINSILTPGYIEGGFLTMIGLTTGIIILIKKVRKEKKKYDRFNLLGNIV